jgi:pSer/pThr/pTyr-binding forkhead associated (FHA) protein
LILVIHTGDSQQRYEFARDEVILGRASESDIAIFDGRVSRKHFWFRRANGAWSVHTHAGISRGTTLNGVNLYEPRLLVAGDRLRIVDILIEIVEAC